MLTPLIGHLTGRGREWSLRLSLSCPHPSPRLLPALSSASLSLCRTWAPGTPGGGPPGAGEGHACGSVLIPTPHPCRGHPPTPATGIPSRGRSRAPSPLLSHQDNYGCSFKLEADGQRRCQGPHSVPLSLGFPVCSRSDVARWPLRVSQGLLPRLPLLRFPSM